MAKLVNEFSWSISRAAKLDDCPRAYHLHYYASWGGWERGAPEHTHRLWVLKRLTSRQAWAGSTVHDTIQWALERVRAGGELPGRDAALERMHHSMRQGFRDSRDGVYWQRKALGLVEHEYQEPVPDAEWKANWERAESSLAGFYASAVLQEILAVPPEHWFPIDALDTFELDGVKVFVAPDFALRDSEQGKVRILDWKTGRPREKDVLQVQGYALFAMARWGVAREELVGELHYLGEGHARIVDVTEEALEGFRSTFRASVEAMRAGLVDVAGNVADPAAFPPQPKAARCRRCNFRGVCDAALLAEDGAEASAQSEDASD